MRTASLRADFLLLVTAAIWGVSFVAQRVGMEYLGPFTFNGLRFGLGSLSLLPLIYFAPQWGQPDQLPKYSFQLWSGVLAGIVLFGGASLQQAGMIWTTAGKAGFITGLYVLMVPILGLIWRNFPPLGTWLGTALAAIGLYFLSVGEEFTLSRGDGLVLFSAIFWAAHVLLIARLASRVNVIKLSAAQFAVCSILSLAVAFLVEEVRLELIVDAAVPVLYGGFGSVGIAYTLQVIAQKDAPPAHTAIILSLEGAFAAMGGWLILDELLSFRALFGCGLILLGMLISQLYPYILVARQKRAMKRVG
ncbi:MAG: DMT family transporter [Thermodesulfobacteriota bacterium]